MARKTKRCGKCGRRRLTKRNFYIDTRLRDGFFKWCKSCHREAGKKVYLKNFRKNRKRLNEAARRYRLKNPEKVRAWRKRYERENRKKLLRAKRVRRLGEYGLTAESHKALTKKQKNRCAICGGPPDGRWRRLQIDHDHKTRKVRGLLCISCNLAIGFLKDDPVIVRALLKYLLRWRRR